MQRSDLDTLKYHAISLNAALEAFIKRAPEFPGDRELASVLGTQMANILNWITDMRTEI